MNQSRLFVLTVVLGVFTALPVDAALAIRLAGNQASISGARPLARVTIVAYGHYSVNGVDTEFEFSTEASADAAGAFSVTPPVIPFQSVWVAMDSAGDFAVAAPSGYRNRLAAVPAGAIAITGAIANDMLGSVIWVVRPGVGRWRGVLAHGSASDESAHGISTVKRSLSRFTSPDAAAPPLATVLPGDLIVAFGFDMQYWTLHLALPR